MARPIVVSLFDFTGNMVAPWARAGFLCYCVDGKHPAGERRDGNIISVGADVRDWPPGTNRAMLRSVTPKGFAEAVHQANAFFRR